MIVDATDAMTPRRALVADNDSIIRSVLRSLLSKIGHVVDQADTTEQALLLAARTAYHFVMLDLDMPSDGGLLTCRRLRQDERYADPPIAILTGLTSADARSRAMDAGATLFLSKPFNPAELMRALAPHLRIQPGDRTRLDDILASDRGLRLRDGAVARAEARVY